MTAGAANKAAGGSIVLTTSGSSQSTLDGGNGGSVQGKARRLAFDLGGPVLVQGGWARAGTGGRVDLMTGVGAATSSGHMSLRTADAGIAGTSGSIAVGTGAATADFYEEVRVMTGDARGGRAITLAVGLT